MKTHQYTQILRKCGLAAVLTASILQAHGVDLGLEKNDDPEATGKVNEEIIATETATAEAAASLNMETSRIYSTLIPFRYIPSERDPFISFKIRSPFVTEEDIPIEENKNEKLINNARLSLKKKIEAALKVGGISTGHNGLNYVLINRNQIGSPGSEIRVPIEAIDGGELNVLEANISKALFKKEKDPVTGETFLLLEITKIEGRKVWVADPGTPGEEIMQEFEMKKGATIREQKK